MVKKEAPRVRRQVKKLQRKAESTAADIQKRSRQSMRKATANKKKQ
jgi:hypothetical protein